MNVLFVCTGNACRSICAEAVFNHLTETGHRAASGGSHPTGEVSPLTLAWLQGQGISTCGLASTSWEELEVTPDVVITVCDNVAGEACPLYLGKALRAHWGVPDPAKAEGSEAEIDAAFASAFRTLYHRIEALLTLPLDELSPDALSRALEEIHRGIPRDDQGETS